MHSTLTITAFLALALCHFGNSQYSGPLTPEGCYSSNIGKFTEQYIPPVGLSWGNCNTHCITTNATVMSLQGKVCWCGNALPPVSKQVSDSYCNTPCSYFPNNTCGGPGVYSVLTTSFVTGQEIPHLAETSSKPPGSAPTSSAYSVAPTTKVSVVTVAPIHNVTVSETLAPTGSTSGSPSSGGSNKAGIAAGVVVGLVALGAIVGGVYFFLSHRRRKALEKSHRRQSSINAFAKAQRTPHMSVLPTQDSRLDPIIAARRKSDGSIADNVDFSRRVLKVTNPDDRW